MIPLATISDINFFNSFISLFLRVRMANFSSSWSILYSGYRTFLDDNVCTAAYLTTAFARLFLSFWVVLPYIVDQIGNQVSWFPQLRKVSSRFICLMLQQILGEVYSELKRSICVYMKKPNISFLTGLSKNINTMSYPKYRQQWCKVAVLLILLFQYLSPLIKSPW